MAANGKHSLQTKDNKTHHIITAWHLTSDDFVLLSKIMKCIEYVIHCANYNGLKNPACMALSLK